MSNKCDELQSRCNELAKWLKQRGTSSPEEEDIELLEFFLRKCSDESLGIKLVCDSSYFLGYRKGYEVKNLELLAGKE